MAVHCETSTGIVNPVDEIGDIVKKYAPGKRVRQGQIKKGD